MSSFEAVQSKKERLRRRYRTRRDALPSEQCARSSQAISRRLSDQSVLQSAQIIAGYMALGGEVDVRELLSRCLAQHKTIALPRVVGPGQMEFCPIEGWDELAPGSFGIEEPRSAPMKTERIEVFLVPGLAFDHRGHRLGFGKGFYDRALPPTGQALAIGVAHHWQWVDESLPIEAHDRLMDVIVTDREWAAISHHAATSQE